MCLYEHGMTLILAPHTLTGVKYCAHTKGALLNKIAN